ncbi:hypothetical protein [Levilactobacillus brevis]|uniref:hypothetical protein n=2 Tax=Levilactobacillus brevis TaxID=1580 RepID=UPI001F316612|nr:hypothetical protein [Levilactobacillus brevis]
MELRSLAHGVLFLYVIELFFVLCESWQVLYLSKHINKSLEVINMDEHEQQRLEELAERRRPALEIRAEMAGLQDKKYRENRKSLATSKEQVQFLLNLWSEAANQHLAGEPIPVDLHKYSGLDQSGYGENSMNRFIDDVHQQIIQAVGDRDTHKYLWVTQRVKMVWSLRWVRLLLKRCYIRGKNPRLTVMTYSSN